MQQGQGKVFEGRSSGRQFPSSATLIQHPGRVSDRGARGFGFAPVMHSQLCSRMKNQTKVASKETASGLCPRTLKFTEVCVTVCVKPGVGSQGQRTLKCSSLDFSWG